MQRSIWTGAVFLMVSLFVMACGTSKDQESSFRSGATGDVTTTATSPEAVLKTDSRPIIVALGDSLTAGHGVDPSDSYPARLQRKIDRAGYQYRVMNEGVSGDTSAQGLNRLEAVRLLRPQIVILELGANDGLRGVPVEETRGNLDAIIRGLREDGVQVILAGMRVPPNYGMDYSEEFHSIFPALAEKYGLVLIPFFLEGVGGHPELNQEDGVHPTAEGYEIVTENVWKALLPQLK